MNFDNATFGIAERSQHRRASSVKGNICHPHTASGFRRKICSIYKPNAIAISMPLHTIHTKTITTSRGCKRESHANVRRCETCTHVHEQYIVHSSQILVEEYVLTLLLYEYPSHSPKLRCAGRKQEIISRFSGASHECAYRLTSRRHNAKPASCELSGNAFC